MNNSTKHPAFADLPPIGMDEIQPTVQIKSQASNNPANWPEIKPLNDTLKPVLEFNFNLLPDNTAGFIQDISHRMQCPPDFSAVGLMVALSSVIGRKCGIHPKQKDDWLVVCNLWGMIVGRPSAMKTPSLEAATAPLKRLEIAAKERFEKETDDYLAEEILQKLNQENAQKTARALIKDGKPDAAKNELSKSLQLTPEPTRKRYIVHDCTIEKLGELLNENPNGILQLRDELTGWLKGLDREDRSQDKAFYLEAWNGNGRYTYDRIIRGTVDIEACCVSVLGTVQPSKLQETVRGAVKGYSDDGFLQRFQLSVYPDTKADWKYVDQYPSKEAKSAVYDIFSRIADWEPKTTEGEFFALRFDDEAQGLFSEWLTELEQEIREPDIHPAMESHLKKYTSLIPSLALILHIAQNETITNHSKVTVNSLNKAIAWGEYLRSHSERIFHIGLNSGSSNAKTILAKIKKGDLGNGFGTRDIIRRGWSGLSELADVKEGLEILCEHGYLREIVQKQTDRGRPSVDYQINPKFHAKT